MKTLKSRSTQKIILIMLTLATIAYAAYIVISFRNKSIALKQNALTEVEKGKTDIENYMKKAEGLADAIAEGLRDGGIAPDDLKRVLKETIDDNNDLYEVGVAFAPKKYKGERNYSPLYRRPGGITKYGEVDYDYAKVHPDNSEIKNQWYLDPMEKKTGMWMEPYYCSVVKTMLMEYSRPFYLDGDDEPDGVVYAGYSLDWLRKHMRKQRFHETGYGALISRKGRFVYYPKNEIVEKGTNIYELADQIKKTTDDKKLKKDCDDFKKLLDRIKKEKIGCYSYLSIIEREKTMVCAHPLGQTGWTIFALYMEEEFNRPLYTYKIRIIAGIILVALTLCFALLYFFHAKGWRVSLGVAAVLILSTITIWILSWKYMEKDAAGHGKLTNIQSMNAFEDLLKDEYKELNRSGQHHNKPRFIPTGIFIQSAKFDDANDLEISGYVWQKYDDGTLGIERGVIFPEAVEVRLDEAYQKEIDGIRLIGWHFSAKIREPFDYEKYPFDKENIWIRLRHPEFYKNILLTPDIESYAQIYPKLKPGIEKNFALSGWDVRSAFFSYKMNEYNSDLGFKKKSGRTSLPELYYNIAVQRSYLNPFMAHLLPLCVIFLMLFSILLVSRKGDKNSVFGFNTLSTLTACSALFFVIIFDHVSLRKSLSVSGLVYFEWFYLFAYLSIIYVSGNAIYIAQSKTYEYGENSPIMAFFGPILSALLFIVTLVYFYD